MANPQDAKGIMARLLAGEGAQIAGDLPFDDVSAIPSGNAIRLTASETSVETGPDCLAYHPTNLCLGVGASRDCSPDELEALVLQAMAEHQLPLSSFAGVFSLDVKMDEAAVHHVADRFAIPARFFDAVTLERETPRLKNPSSVVFSEVGCHGVSEAAALAAAGPNGELIVEKRKSAMATVAIARAPGPLLDLPGSCRGTVVLVGIGPGEAGLRTPHATRAVQQADELVGYSLYIDLLGPLAAGKVRKAFPLGDEEARCRYSLERAGEGANVALVCSGDPGVYAMAALVFELLDRGDTEGGVSMAARRASVDVIPGVTAMQTAAARMGAPLGHDFCAISLSDLLTPREAIIKRVEAAAAGDFVISFYNPVSRTRRDLLAIARDILLKHRPPATPVMLAVNLGRPEERILHRTLETLSVDEVDMLTTVVVGASQTRRFRNGDGDHVYTPRGYARKLERGAA